MARTTIGLLTGNAPRNGIIDLGPAAVPEGVQSAELSIIRGTWTPIADPDAILCSMLAELSQDNGATWSKLMRIGMKAGDGTQWLSVFLPGPAPATGWLARATIACATTLRFQVDLELDTIRGFPRKQ